jgi:hypothetical protein
VNDLKPVGPAGDRRPLLDTPKGARGLATERELGGTCLSGRREHIAREFVERVAVRALNTSAPPTRTRPPPDRQTCVSDALEVIAILAFHTQGPKEARNEEA